GGCACSRRFASLGLGLAPPFGQLSAWTASLHVARLRRFTTMLNPRQIPASAPWQWRAINGVLAMFASVISGHDVRFTPESGHVQRPTTCLLWANSGHGVPAVRGP